jgi:hypothetical protein
MKPRLNQLHFIWVTALCLLAASVSAQDTNALKTTLGVFEAQTGVLMVKSFGPIGSMSVGAAEISVRGKETWEVNTSHKLHGLDIEITGNNPARERIMVDDDEIAALLGAMDYFLKITSDVTTLPSFDATYTTKCGLRFSAYSVRKNGGIQLFLQYDDHPRMALTTAQIAQLYALIDQAAKALDALPAGK